MLATRWILAVALGWPSLVVAEAIDRALAHASIETVQMPAWLERDGRTQPLAVGMEVRNGDRIRSGAQARVYIGLADGSTLKLGEHALLNFYSRSLKPVSNFRAALDMPKGAFRFTTDASQRLRGQREVSIRVGTATAGVRGADLWGKSDAARDLILLIEGNIEIRYGGATYELIEPLTYFAAPRNAAPQALARADPESFRQSARQTEVLPGDGAAQRGGKWNVLLVRAGQQGEALAAYDKARSAGYAAQVRVRPAAGKPDKGGDWSYEVLLSQLGSEQDAAMLAEKVRARLGFDATPLK